MLVDRVDLFHELDLAMASLSRRWNASVPNDAKATKPRKVRTRNLALSFRSVAT
jgi:hypothetical protein